MSCDGLMVVESTERACLVSHLNLHHRRCRRRRHIKRCSAGSTANGANEGRRCSCGFFFNVFFLNAFFLKFVLGFFWVLILIKR